jgi:hypothetical protein
MRRIPNERVFTPAGCLVRIAGAVVAAAILAAWWLAGRLAGR